MLAAICLALHASPAAAQVTVVAETLGGGGGAATDGSYLIAGTLDQALIGPVDNSADIIGQGFWYTLPVQVTSSVAYEPVVAGSGVVLYQNVPNPFSSSTTIAFYLPASGYVSLKLYDAVGREVRTLIDDVREAGRVSTLLSASDLESGYYTARLNANGVSKTITMVVVR
jgi:hypothetical protein